VLDIVEAPWSQVLHEIDECKKAYPNACIRCLAFEKQAPGSVHGFLSFKNLASKAIVVSESSKIFYCFSLLSIHTIFMMLQYSDFTYHVFDKPRLA
jgi:hypothetical protein